MTSHFLGPNAMRALRACLALACVALGVTTLPDGVSARTQPTTWITVTYDATAARDPDALHGQVVLRHETDEDPHKLLIEPPPAPSGLRAELGRVDGEVRLSWNAPAPADDIDHHDYRYHTGGRYGAWTSIPASGSSSNHVGYVNGLTGGVEHTFQVRAINTNDDTSLPSATATVTPRGGATAPREGGGGPSGTVVTLELSPSSIGEGSEVSTVTASLDSASATALTVTVSAEAVAPAAPGDFALSANRTLAIAAGALTSTGTVTISAVDNTVDAPDKDVTVSGTVAGATDVTGPSDVTLTITDDDRPTATTCTGGKAGVNLCSNIDLMSYLAMNDIGGGIGNDIWGWQDPLTGKEYAIVGRSTGTAFVDISDPLSLIYLGNLPPHSGNSQWRDMKVYLDHAFIVSEADGSGMQVFDLTQLRTVSSAPVTFSETAHYAGFSDAHNISINTDSGFAYAVGTDTCDGGLHMINIQNPANPTSAGCFSDDGYTHDAQCVNYIGPDPDHQGAEVCFNSNIDTLTIVDVTNKARPAMISRTGYRGARYTHQGWLTEDHAYFVLGDELDERRDPYNTGTTTYLWDVSDLDSPRLTGTHASTTKAIDHNQYVKGRYTFQSNYQAGLRILDVTDIANGGLTEVAFFDMVPGGDSPWSLYGTWGNYPFFDSGIVIVSVRTQGLFVLRPNLVDHIQPKVARAVVDRETLTLTYGEALDETATPAIDAFAVTVEDAERSVSGVSVSGRAVTLTLASAVTVAEEVTVTYTVPETNPIRDEAQNNAPLLSSRGVRNDTTGPPGTPGAPTVTAASATSLMVTWVEPPNAQPPITDYDVQYRIGSSGSFTDWAHAGTALTATIPRLIEGTTYQVQVLARNPVGVSSWSEPASGAPATPPNTAPTALAMATTSTTVNGLGTVTLDGSANDPEGDTLTYRWTSSGGGMFGDASLLHTIWTAPDKTDIAQDIVLTLTVTDDGAGQLSHAAEVNVRVRENQRPIAEVSPDTATVDGGEEVELEATASDPDTTTLTYDWTSSGGGTFEDAAVLKAKWTAPDKTDVAQYITLTLKVTDDGHVERAATETVQVTVRANLAPEATATATTPTTVTGGGTVTLHGTATDPDGDGLRHTWSSNGGGSFVNASALDTTWTAPRKTNGVQNIVLTLTVTEDRAGARTETANVGVTVRANRAPVATATAITPTTVNGDGTVMLRGTATDPDGDGLRHTWSSNGGGSFDNASALDPTWTAPRKTNDVQNIVLTLTVTEDRVGARTETANVGVTVRANQAPRVTVSPTTATVDGGEEVALDGMASDRDGDSLRHTWSSNGGGSFHDASALGTTWTAPPKTNDVQNIVLTLTVTEDRAGARTETANVGVTVRANQAPRVTVSPTTATVDGGEEVALDGMASDRDDGTLTYRWSSDGGGAFDDDEALVTPWFAPRATAANERLVLTLTVTDSANASASATASVTVRANQAPRVTVSPSTARVDGEEVLAVSGAATDPEGDRLTYIWSSNGGGSFRDASALDTTWTAPRKTNDVQNIVLTLTVTEDRVGARTETANVGVTVRANQAPRVTVSPTTATVDGGEEVALDGMASDRDDGTLTYRWSSDGGGAFDDDEALVTPWFAPRATAANERLVLTLTVTDSANASASATASVTVRANQAPRVTVSPSTARVDGEEVLAVSGAATDPEGDRLTFAWSSNGGGSFDDAGASDTTWTAPATTADVQNITLTLTVTDDGAGRLTHAAEVRVTVPGNTPPPDPITSGGGGGGGGGGGPSPSVVDFEWTVSRDIDELGGGHDKPSGTWSDGTTLWVLENGDGADDAIYAYDLATGERVDDREFELDETNRAPRGVWSDRTVLWVSDSGQERLFAHDFETGERLPERDIVLHERNGDPRGIWSGDGTMWALDGGKESLFAYDLGSGESLAEYALDDANDDPRGLFFDGVTFWVSDHGEKRIFAYRLEAGEDGADELERNRDEEFPGTVLSRASNNSPRGIWSDGDVMYVADESDAKVYTYNMPNAIDARLASLSLSGVDFGEFSPNHEEYEGAADEGVTETTVTAEALQRGTDVDIDPPDADEAAEGYQVALEDLGEITVTVTSADGSRERVYRVRLGEEEVAELAPEEAAEPAPEEAAGPVASCLRGDIAVGFSLIVYAGGGLEDLEACAEGRNVAALYTLDEGTFTSLILGAPDFVNQPFRGLFAGGVPSISPFIVRSEGPPTADPGSGRTPDDGAQWPDCLRGDIAAGFSLVVHEGGSVDELEACAQSRDVAALYALSDGEFVSYILGAPAFVTQPFRDLFADGLPLMTPLVARSEGPPGAR